MHEDMPDHEEQTDRVNDVDDWTVTDGYEEN